MSDKERQNEEQSSEAIVEETMKEIMASIAESEEKEKSLKDETSGESEEVEQEMTFEDEEEMESEILFLNDEDESEAASRKPRNRKHNGMIIAGVLGAVFLIYLGFSLFFINHFYFGTKINDVSFSGKTVKDVEKYMKKQVSDYTLTLKERNGKTELIKGSTVELQYKNGKGVEELKEKQNPFLWYGSFWRQ